MGDTYEEQQKVWERMQEKRRAKRPYSDASEENSKEKGGFDG